MADNVLGTLFGDIANAIRSKTGDTATMKPIDFPTKILEIEGGGATTVDIIPEQEFTFTYDETNGVHILTGNSLYNITDIITGKEYEVVWGTNEFSCTAFESTFFGYPCVAIGNPVSLGGGSNDIPFTILHVVSDDPEVNKVCYVIGLDGSTSKKVHIYQEASGGVQDDRVKYVTFIGLNGVELYRQPVIVGDTCHDPVSKGYISTPTKESTVSQVFTYNGWSLTEGGSASSSALTNVTEDRTVYVAFTSTAIKYTITYYDSDGVTILKTEEKPYGSIIGYIPEKKGYSFAGWQPSTEIVTGDASYIALWTENVTFANGSWEDIIEIAESGNAADYFNIGDTRTEYLNYTDGTSEEITLTIAGINFDMEKGITLASNVLAENRTYHYSYSLTDGWGATAEGDQRYIYRYLKTTVYNALSEKLRGGIKTLTTTTNNTTSNDKIFLFSQGETYNRYPLFKDNENMSAEKRIGYKIDGTPSSYWCRDVKTSSGKKTIYPYYINTEGIAKSDLQQTNTLGVRFGICI